MPLEVSGCVDGFTSPRKLIGWARSPEYNQEFIYIVAELGGQQIGSTQANDFRQDMNAFVGFSLNLSEDITEEQLVAGEVSVFILLGENKIKIDYYDIMLESIISRINEKRKENSFIAMECLNLNSYCSIPLNIEEEIIRLRVNPPGEMPPKIKFSHPRWLGGQRIIFFSARNTSQTHSLCLTLISQSENESPVTNTIDIAPEEVRDFNLSFWSNETQASFSIAIEPLISNSTYSKCDLEIQYKGIVSPPILARHPKAYILNKSISVNDLISTPYFASVIMTGLVNRLSPLVSLSDIGKKLNVPVILFWEPTLHCAAELEDLIDIEASGLTSIEYSKLPGPAVNFCNTHQLDNRTIPLSDYNNSGIYVCSWTDLSVDGIQTTPADIKRAFGDFIPSKIVIDKIERFNHHDFSKTIGVHVRRPYINPVFSKIEESIFTHDAGFFADLIKDILSANPDMDYVFLCSNREDSIIEMRKSLGDKVFEFEKDATDNTTESVAVQDAFVDLLLLSKCSIILSHEHSTWGRFSRMIGGSTLFQVRGRSRVDEPIDMRFVDVDGQEILFSHRIGTEFKIKNPYNS